MRYCSEIIKKHGLAELFVERRIDLVYFTLSKLNSYNSHNFW